MKYLYKTILSIEKSIELLPEISYEIIISLDNPDDETIRVAKFLSKKKQIRIFESSFGNPADNRNFAISKAKGSICALVDGDEIIILLNAGDKDSQSDDIKKAKEILKDYRWKKNLQNLI